MQHQHQQRICNNNNVLVWLIQQYCNSGDTVFLKEAYMYYANCLIEKKSKHQDSNISAFIRLKMQHFVNTTITGNNKVNRTRGVRNGQKLLFEAVAMVESKYNANDIVKLLCKHVQGVMREMQDIRALERSKIYKNAAEAWLVQQNNINTDNALYGITSTSGGEEERQARIAPTHHYYFRQDKCQRQDRDEGWPGCEEEAA